MSRKDPGVAEMSGEAPTARGEDWSVVTPLSGALRTLDRMIRDIAPTDIPILLMGESGSGRDVVALRIHRLSQRKEGPFVKVACGAQSSSAWEGLRPASEGTAQGGNGKVGTIFLDEVCDLDPSCQPKLLQLFPDGDGGDDGQNLRPRLISATERNLEQEIRQGHFSQELLYRLKGVCLRLPPLRNCKEDIPALLDFFLSKHAPRFGRPQPDCDPKTLARLVDYSWPGNFRQLENVAMNIAALGDERLALAELEAFRPEALVRAANQILSLKQAARAAARQAERELILKALDRTHWNRKRAAQELQVSYKALLYKLKQIRIGECG